VTDLVDLKTDQPHPARAYQYWLGGKDNYAADRELGERMAQLLPSLPGAARANRGCVLRSSRYLAREHGIRQFLDLGTGLPVSPNLHEVVQEVDPRSRVVYVERPDRPGARASPARQRPRPGRANPVLTCSG
jgi:hypothetical protein